MIACVEAELLVADVLSAAFSGLPPERAARALLAVDDRAARRRLLRWSDLIRREGYAAGWTASEASMAAAWTDVARRVKASAGSRSFDELLAARGEVEVAPGEYRTIRCPGDRSGAQIVADARAAWAEWEINQNQNTSRGAE